MKFPCMKPTCSLFALPNSAYCEGHQSEQEIQDRHGPLIDEAAGDGTVSKVFAQADEADELAVARSFQEKEGAEKHSGDTAAAIEVGDEKAKKLGKKALADAARKTREDLLNAVHVPLQVNKAQVFTINGVSCLLKKGMNSVPLPVKQAYDDHQEMLDKSNFMKSLLRTTDTPESGEMGEAKPSAYYEDVLRRGYKGEVTKAHERRSQL